MLTISVIIKRYLCGENALKVIIHSVLWVVFYHLWNRLGWLDRSVNSWPNTQRTCTHACQGGLHKQRLGWLGRNRRADSWFKHFTIEYTFYGPQRLVNLVGNQQNECSALHDKQANMYPFRRRLMFANCVWPKRLSKLQRTPATILVLI